MEQIRSTPLLIPGLVAQLGERPAMLHSPYQNQINAPFGACNQGRLVQLGERKVRNLEVRGSIPLSSTIDRKAAILATFLLFLLRGNVLWQLLIQSCEKLPKIKIELDLQAVSFENIHPLDQ